MLLAENKHALRFEPADYWKGRKSERNRTGKMRKEICDVLVIGASLGGVQAARAAAESGASVLLCEETEWIGGQLTSQAVPPDEHPWIETTGATRSYKEYREKVRSYYRSLPQASDAMRYAKEFCPGNSWVSRIAHEPKVAHDILLDSLRPWMECGKLKLLTHTAACSANVDRDRIVDVTLRNTLSGEEILAQADLFLDATDCGDLLPLVGTEYRTGAESKQQTGEPHALEREDPQDIQPVTWVAALELDPDAQTDWKIPRPELYGAFSKIVAPYDDNLQLSWYSADAETGKKRQLLMFDGEMGPQSLGLWSYRRIIDSAHYTDGRKEVTLLNWPANDYSVGNVYDCYDAPLHRELARQLTLCTVYWLQNDAPRKDGGTGYRVRLRPDITGTPDGLAMAPYIRESRRIVAHTTVREQDISRASQSTLPRFADSVGVGHYAVDVHMTTRSHTFFYEKTWPFEIPLGAMIPIRMENLLPACKNIGCTHLTNGCYRLHPVEWNIGEVAGYLAGYCIGKRMTPLQVWQTQCEQFQELLVDKGVQLHWDISLLKGLKLD